MPFLLSITGVDGIYTEFDICRETKGGTGNPSPTGIGSVRTKNRRGVPAGFDALLVYYASVFLFLSTLRIVTELRMPRPITRARRPALLSSPVMTAFIAVLPT